MSALWTQEENDLLAEMWNAGKSYDAIMQALPRHAAVFAIKKACTRLRKMGVELKNRRPVAMPAEEAYWRKREAVQRWQFRQKLKEPDLVPDESVDIFEGVTFEDDPRAYCDGGFARIIPQVSDWVSLTGSSAALAVRSE